MSKRINQKLKLYYLEKILLEKTDADHYITMAQIINELDVYGVSAERKSLYDDIALLEEIGIKVELVKGKGYHIVKRHFDLPELKLLVDAIQSSKFITESRTNDIIKKLEGQVSEYEARQLQRQVYVRGRVKTMNEDVVNNVDILHSAIGDNHKIKFQYFNWNEKKQMILRHDGDYYNISPWALTWDDENYYLVAYDSANKEIRHYRVDKMVNLTETDEPREGKTHFERFNLADYAKQNFGMFNGEVTDVQLSFDNSMAGVIIDRFGSEAMIRPDMERPGWSVVWVKVAISIQFIGWIFSLGDKVIITKPDSVVDRAREEIKRLYQQYF